MGKRIMKRMVEMLFCSLGTIFVLMALPLRAGELLLAEKGTTKYAIVLSNQASKSEKTAAEELAGYLQEITGATFQIITEDKEVPGPRIIVGPGTLGNSILGKEAVGQMAEEEFIIRTAGSDLLLVGGRPRGTLYAVYSFLENDLGYRWLNWYGNEVIPKKETLRVNRIDRKEKPAFRSRDVYFRNYTDMEQMKRFLICNRIQGPNLRWLHGDEYISRYGGIYYREIAPGCHTLFYYIPPGEAPTRCSFAYFQSRDQNNYFKTNPEYFSLIDGRRVPCQQLCFSNPGLRRTLTAEVEKYIKFVEGEGDLSISAVGGKNLLSISAMDSPGDLCQCPECQELVKREGTPGAPLFDYLVELANYIRDKYPGVFITTLAYRRGQTEKPPLHLKMPENVVIVFAPIDNNFSAPFEDQSNEETFENIKSWTSVTKHLLVWYYPNPYGDMLPIGNLENAAKDFRFFRKIGVEGFMLEHDSGIYESHHLADLQTWLLAKLMWNPDQNFNTLTEDFTNNFYGKAAPFIRKYLYALEKATQGMTTTMSWIPAARAYCFLTPELLIASQKIFDQAEEVVLNDPVLLLRVRQARMSLDRASFHFRRDISAIPDSGLEREEIARRYRDTYQKTIEKRIRPEFRQEFSRYVEDFFNPRLRITSTLKLKPLPVPLNEIPEEKVQQVVPDSSQLYRDATIEKDPDSASGIAITKETGGELPFNLGYYDGTTKRQLPRNITKDEICSSGYNLYKIGRTTLNEQCLVWISSSWWIGFPAISACYDSDDPEKEWDIYASLRFEGPTYPHGPKSTVDRVFVDRVVLVPVEE
ncbi:MAG: DUF4838 domain-containing protein [Candidatus Omnitrophota bacterium]